MAEREIERWVTIRGHRVPIFKGETEEDVHKRFSDFVDSKKPKTDYSTCRSKDEMIYKFNTDNPNVWIGPKLVNMMDKKVLADTLNTINDIQSQYGEIINTVTGGATGSDAMASMSTDGKLNLNVDYFEDEEYLNDTYKECVADSYHPNAPSGAIGVISHELGHAIMFKYMKDIMKESNLDNNSFAEAYTYMNEGYVKNTKGNEVYYKLYDKIHEAEEKIASYEPLVKMWYGKDTTAKKVGGASLQRLVNSKSSVSKYAISEYAGTDYHEMIAEAFSDVYCNGSEAHYMSQVIFDTFIKEAKNGK